jgi:hypothetical protein
MPGMSLLDHVQFIDNARLFLDEWGDEAAALGWTMQDLFGVHPAAPDARYDAMGLLPLLRGRRVTSITADRATIRTPSGGSLTYYRHRPHREAVAAWDLLQ